jgi:adenylate cyclase
VLKSKNDIIATEKNRADELLHNILPESVVIELKEKGYVNAKHFEDATVCFIDFVSFSTTAELQHPQALLDDLNTCFKKFDEIITKYNLEKIKTIGDCYMCAGGVPDADSGNQVREMLMATKEINEWLNHWNESRVIENKRPFLARTGIHSGPLAAGVVGTKKFLYDIWGDTVNISARMEQNSETGRINVSESIFDLLNKEFNFTYRGEINAKNKGMLKMYFLD